MNLFVERPCCYYRSDNVIEFENPTALWYNYNPITQSFRAMFLNVRKAVAVTNCVNVLQEYFYMEKKKIIIQTCIVNKSCRLAMDLKTT